ncbi:MAG: hypothetical protein RMK62_12325 [Armatimonadota bacterium]|nr:hypothetical protein [Armatimonadota bacterium]
MEPNRRGLPPPPFSQSALHTAGNPVQESLKYLPRVVTEGSEWSTQSRWQRFTKDCMVDGWPILKMRHTPVYRNSGSAEV